MRVRLVRYARSMPCALALLIGSPPTYAQGEPALRWRGGGVQFMLAPPIFGSVVAVLDTGIHVTHQNIVGRVVAGGTNVVAGNNDFSDTQGHGTIVSSIILGRADPERRARDPLLLPIRIFDGPTTTETQVNAGLAYSIGRATIVNMSIAAVGPVAETGMRASVAAGQLLIVAAGNSGLANPEWPARYAGAAWSNGQIIAVGAVDSSNNIASFSNRAGDAQSNFLVAPGVSVVGAANSSDTGLVFASGTSVAAPYVSGIAALIKAYWPQLTSQQIGNILLTTAIDLGAPGTDAIYGRGLVSQARALAPVGPTMVPTAAGSAVRADATTFAPSAIATTALRAAAVQGRLVGVGLDQFGRQYYYNFGAGIAAAQPLGLNRLLGAADRQTAFSERRFGNARLVYGLAERIAVPTTGLANYETRNQSQTALSAAALNVTLAGGGDIGVGTMGLASTYFGFASAGSEFASLTMQPALANPMFALMAGHHHAGFAQTLPGAVRLKVGLVSNAATESLLVQFGALERRPVRQHAFVAELSTRLGAGFVALSGTQFREHDAYFGGVGEGGLALSARPVTTAWTAQIGYPLTSNLVVGAQFTQAVTQAFTNNSASLLTDTTTTRSNAFALSLAKAQVLSADDRLSLTVSQPLRARTGAMNFDLPIDVDAQGNLMRVREQIGLRPNGRERLAELAYVRPLGHRGRLGNLGVAVIYRSQPNHDANAVSERAAAVRWQRVF